MTTVSCYMYSSCNCTLNTIILITTLLCLCLSTTPHHSLSAVLNTIYSYRHETLHGPDWLLRSTLILLSAMCPMSALCWLYKYYTKLSPFTGQLPLPAKSHNYFQVGWSSIGQARASFLVTPAACFNKSTTFVKFIRLIAICFALSLSKVGY